MQLWKKGSCRIEHITVYFGLCYMPPPISNVKMQENVRYLPFKLLLGNLCQLLPLTKKENVRYLPCYKLLPPAATSHKEGERKVPPFQVAFMEPLQKEPLLQPAATSHKEGEGKVPPFQVAFREPLQKEPLLQPAATSHKEGERKVPPSQVAF